ncbi:hypothetical protein A6A08_22740 [Nocardiopsis sp. TSRI0078]|uniref:hypothetical protein n=1 Tax=unclassified Nocardiopsis TaxID=2649073 RepID=UPI00093ED65C|nr:hypothetical protein [Nocardiopsis sp. TSRI0078]OKI20385.1 hypothetical protein A6A08_22740 [Nocardiopsis sp. TSRI0078]
MRVAILGPLRVVADGRAADVGGARLRALLARLALEAGHRVGHRALADAMPDMPMIAQVAVGTADLLLRREEPERAARVLGTAHALRGGPNPRHPDVDRLLRDLRAHRAAYDRASRLAAEEALATIRAEHDDLTAR